MILDTTKSSFEQTSDDSWQIVPKKVDIKYLAGYLRQVQKLHNLSDDQIMMHSISWQIYKNEVVKEMVKIGFKPEYATEYSEKCFLQFVAGVLPKEIIEFWIK